MAASFITQATVLPVFRLTSKKEIRALKERFTLFEGIPDEDSMSLRHGERIDADRELLGLGLANVGSAMLGGMAVSGGLSRSVVNEAAGARSPLAGVLTSVALGGILLVCLPLLAYLPKAALAAVIITAVSGLVQMRPSPA